MLTPTAYPPEYEPLRNRFSTLLSSPASESSSLSGDYIGMESCVDLHDNEEELTSEGGESSERRGRRDQRSEKKTKAQTKKEFPPPIPSLARTGNLPSHMPWIMRRYHTSDGRLIIKEEKVKYHEYFRAHRENGRLTLHLIPMDAGEIEKEEDYEENLDEEAEEDEEEEVEESPSSPSSPSCVEMKNGRKWCVRSRSSCKFGMAVAGVRQVHI